jgi:hypothetical protein
VAKLKSKYQNELKLQIFSKYLVRDLAQEVYGPNLAIFISHPKYIYPKDCLKKRRNYGLNLKNYIKNKQAQYY